MKNKNNVEVEKINIKERNKGHYTSVLSRVASLAGQDPGKHARAWVNTADSLVIAKSNEDVVGFSAYKMFDSQFVHIAATMIVPDYQGMGIGGKMTRLIIKDSMKVKLKESFTKPFSFSVFKPMYIFFRTQNPSVYAGFYGRTKIYPNFNNEALPEPALKKLKNFTTHLWPKADLDDENLIIKNAYTENPGLALKPDSVPWSNNKKIDKFFSEKLNLREQSEKAMLVVSKVTIPSLLKIKL